MRFVPPLACAVIVLMGGAARATPSVSGHVATTSIQDGGARITVLEDVEFLDARTDAGPTAGTDATDAGARLEIEAWGAPSRVDASDADATLRIEPWGAPSRTDQPDAGARLEIEEWGAAESGDAPDAGTSSLTIEELTPVESPDGGTSARGLPAGSLDSFGSSADGAAESSPPSASARVYGTLRSQAGVDTAFDSPRGDPLAENVFDWRTRMLLGADVKLSDSLRLVAEARAWWRITGERGFDRTKAIFELEPGETFVDVYTRRVDLRLGNQVVAFGANPAFAPSDQLNPRDLREGFILGEPEDVKLPNVGARAVGTVGRVDVTAVYFPFFKPNRYSVTGQDEAMVQPALGLDLPRDADESIEDGLQPHLLETKRPKAFPWLGDLGVRGSTKAGPVTLGASWIWINEKTPLVTLDPELAALVRAGARGNDPDKAIAASVQDRLLAGETLVTGEYPRQHVIALQAQTLIRSAQVDLDLAYSPAQTIYGSALNPLRKQIITWVVGVSQAEDSPLLYNVTYVGIAVPDLPSEDYLFLLEPATAANTPRTVGFHAVFATVGYSFLDERLEVSVRGAFEPVQRSWALAPKVAWKGWARMTVALGAELYEGKVYSPFGYFGRNDQVVAQLSYDVF